MLHFSYTSVGGKKKEGSPVTEAAEGQITRGPRNVSRGWQVEAVTSAGGDGRNKSPERREARK